MELRFSDDAVVVVAGMPGAGKTTLIRRAVDPAAVRVVDTEDRRERGERASYLGHYARIVGAVAGRRPAVIHSRGTHAVARRAIALLARLRGRPAHLVMIDAPRAAAEAGQRRRGRMVPEAEMARQVERWHRLMSRLPTREGWASVVVLDRDQAASTSAFAFISPVTNRAAAATM